MITSTVSKPAAVKHLVMYDGSASFISCTASLSTSDEPSVSYGSAETATYKKKCAPNQLCTALIHSKIPNTILQLLVTSSDRFEDMFNNAVRSDERTCVID